MRSVIAVQIEHFIKPFQLGFFVLFCFVFFFVTLCCPNGNFPMTNSGRFLQGSREQREHVSDRSGVAVGIEKTASDRSSVAVSMCLV